MLIMRISSAKLPYNMFSIFTEVDQSGFAKEGLGLRLCCWHWHVARRDFTQIKSHSHCYVS
jgi:hypothetical protein